MPFLESWVPRADGPRKMRVWHETSLKAFLSAKLFYCHGGIEATHVNTSKQNLLVGNQFLLRLTRPQGRVGTLLQNVICMLYVREVSLGSTEG